MNKGHHSSADDPPAHIVLIARMLICFLGFLLFVVPFVFSYFSPEKYVIRASLLMSVGATLMLLGFALPKNVVANWVIALTGLPSGE